MSGIDSTNNDVKRTAIIGDEATVSDIGAIAAPHSRLDNHQGKVNWPLRKQIAAWVL